MARLYLQEKVILRERVSKFYHKKESVKFYSNKVKNIQIYHLFINAYREKQKVR